jgi:selenocysteine lyase/cysteine desulfurase
MSKQKKSIKKKLIKKKEVKLPSIVFDEDFIQQPVIKIDKTYNSLNLAVIKDKLYADLNIKSESYSLFFTSGEIESNTIVLCAIINAYKLAKPGIKPHIILSAVEPASINKYILSLKSSGTIDITILKPNIYGCILSEHIDKAITPNTCCAIISYINREMGSVNNIGAISTILHNKKIPLHCDCSYMFGRHKLDLERDNIDSAVLSYDKLQGIFGIGVIVIKNDLLNGYNLKEQSVTLDNKKPVNISLLKMVHKMLLESLKDRAAKNKKLLQLRKYFIESLNKKYEFITYADYINSDAPPLEDALSKKIKIITLGPPINNEAYYTFSIVSIIFVCDTPAKDIKEKLEKKNILISIPEIGNSSEILYKEMNMEANLKNNIVRFFIHDSITSAEIDILIKEISNIL